LVFASGGSLLLPRQAQAAQSKQELVKLLEELDRRQNSVGDFKAEVYLESTTKGEAESAYKLLVFRRSEPADRRFIMLFTEPKTARGQGYLRIGRNVWFYDPSVGRWERRTERARIAGTTSRRSDFDQSRMAEEYDPEDQGEAPLGAYQTYVMTLRVKPGVDVAFPVLKLWVDKKTLNVLKRQDFALSGKLLRTAYYPKWGRALNKATGEQVWYPSESRLFDELEVGDNSLIVVKNVDLAKQDKNVFTKAWLEGKSR
jgi:outer membrane lipoprotein-sorting protein